MSDVHRERSNRRQRRNVPIEKGHECPRTTVKQSHKPVLLVVDRYLRLVCRDLTSVLRRTDLFVLLNGTSMKVPELPSEQYSAGPLARAMSADETVIWLTPSRARHAPLSAPFAPPALPRARTTHFDTSLCCGWESLMKSVTLGNVTMSHRTRGPPNARLSHSTMIGLPRAQH
ncbi:hypothetical protein EVAR_87383_1 [Eumeta japonica]|uniref:Uncharacterized protein n=1 Tax=Eumeta variegata TaxID=151549 RepID=A0A4C1Y146_EUMVA|nr:hypothetical protein EVAR_87383_1 [Eumeta japonica]